MSQAAPVDAHLYAEDTAREVAALVKPGAVLLVEAPDGYYQMAAVAQLRTRGFTVSERAGTPVRFALADADRGATTRVDLVVGADRLWRAYEPRSGRPSGEWTRRPALERPAEQALDEPAQLYQLGRLVESGSPDRAMRYYRLAAELGHKDADLRLGLMLIANGKAEEGLRFISVASDAGNAQAEYVLGLAYLNGTVVAKNPVRGRALLHKAADAGVKAARQALGSGAPSR